MSQTKRQNRTNPSNGCSISSTPIDPTTQKLQTMGMRIRKAVSDGYILPNQYQYEQQNQQLNSGYLTDYEIKHIQSLRGSTLTHQQPPSLSFNLSTASSLSDWESNSAPHKIQTISSQSFTYGTKRSSDESEEKPKDLTEYVNQYGNLSFNEEF